MAEPSCASSASCRSARKAPESEPRSHPTHATPPGTKTIRTSLPRRSLTKEMAPANQSPEPEPDAAEWFNSYGW